MRVPEGQPVRPGSEIERERAYSLVLMELDRSFKRDITDKGLDVRRFGQNFVVARRVLEKLRRKVL